MTPPNVESPHLGLRQRTQKNTGKLAASVRSHSYLVKMNELKAVLVTSATA